MTRSSSLITRVCPSASYSSVSVTVVPFHARVRCPCRPKTVHGESHAQPTPGLRAYFNLPSTHTRSEFFLSFFDEDDEPTRRAPRPRRAAPAGGLDVDPQTLWVRRGIALGAGLLILIVLFVLVNACQDSRRKNSMRDYNRESAALVSQSDDEVGGQF